MKVGDVINTKDKNPLSFVINVFTKSIYAHSACYVGGTKCIEAHVSGVRLIDLEDITKKYDVFRHKTANSYQLKKATDWMINRLGKKYDFGGLMGIGLAIMGDSKVNSFDDKNSYWCSELIADGYINAGINNDFDKNTWKISPGDFAKSKYFRKVTK